MKDLIEETFYGSITIKSMLDKGTTFVINIPKEVFREGIILRYYIVDDDINIVKILSNIIDENNLGDVTGHSHEWRLRL